MISKVSIIFFICLNRNVVNDTMFIVCIDETFTKKGCPEKHFFLFGDPLSYELA